LRAPLERIDHALELRTREQLARGLEAEALRGAEAGVPLASGVLTGVGAADVLRQRASGNTDAEELFRAVLRSNQQLARRQLRWLRSERDVVWFDVDSDPVPPIVDLIRGNTL
jgi:tRNA A37 N6-isopentenylltransferase MiaA